MIAPCVDPDVRLERMRMALAEIGVDGSHLYFDGAAIRNLGDVVPFEAFWRAMQITGPRRVYCFKCWQADNYQPHRPTTASCCAPPGIVDCGRTDR